jgi:glutathione S-transferase
LAAKFDLTAQDPFDDAKCDEYMDSLRDFCDQLRPYSHSKDEDQKAMALARLKNFVIPRYLGKFDAIISANNGTNLVGSKLTWADIYFAHSLRNFSHVLKIDFIEKYPAVANLVNHVYSIPAIQDWVEVRPKSSW